MRYAKLLMLTLIAVTLFCCVYAFPYLPEQIASHWNVSGVADGYLSTFWGTVLFPGTQIVLFGLYLLLPRIDPLRRNIALFQKTYDTFWLFLILFLTYLCAISLVWNLGYPFNVMNAMIPALSALLLIIGYSLPRTRQNWFFGIRTPWTLASSNVWNKTHAVAGKLFLCLSWVPLLAYLSHTTLFVGFVLIAPFLLPALVAIPYSYILFKNEH